MATNAEAGPSSQRLDGSSSTVDNVGRSHTSREEGPLRQASEHASGAIGVQTFQHPLSRTPERQSSRAPGSLKDGYDGVATPVPPADVALDASHDEHAVTGQQTDGRPDSRLLHQAHIQLQREQRDREQAQRQPNEAMMVRRNMVRNSWQSFRNLSRWSRAIYILRLGSGLAQLAVGIAILSLPTSLGDSNSSPETCDPEGMFVYLFLHTARTFATLPIDFYLGLSPHRSARSRRPDSAGHDERERNRRIGSLQLDRRIARLSDLLSFFHVVLFIFGNYIVWTNTSCSHRPADSIPLFYTCVAMLSITYLIIFEVALILFLVIFFLPVLIAVMSALGLSHRLPQRRLHPDTDKIDQDSIEKHSQLVYYTADHSSEGKAEEQGADDKAEVDGTATPSHTLLRGDADIKSGHHAVTVSPAEDSRHEGAQDSVSISSKAQTAGPANGARMSRRFMHVFGWRRRSSRKASLDMRKADGTDADVKQQYKYPLHPIPAHRATCPICLCDYEELSALTAATARQQSDAANGGSTDADAPADIEPEPLRLLECGHAMHRSCVDQWLTTVSGRCPVCQKPLLGPGKGDGPSNGDTAGDNTHDDALGFNTLEV